MWKSIVSIVIAFVLLGLLVGGGLLYHDAHPPQTNQTPLPSNVTLAKIAQWNELTVQSKAWKAGTEAANQFAKTYNATNTDEYDDIDLYPETINLESLYNDFNVFALDWTEPPIYRLLAYFTAYLNAGGDPNYAMHVKNIRDIYTDRPILYRLVDKYRHQVLTSISSNEHAPFFPKPFMDFIALLNDKGYTNWNYGKGTDDASLLANYVFQAGLITMQRLDVYEHKYDRFPEIGSNTSEHVLNVIRILINYGMDVTATGEDAFREGPFSSISCRFKLDAQSNVLAQSITGDDPWVPLEQADPVDTNDMYDEEWNRKEWREVQKVIQLYLAHGARNVTYEDMAERQWLAPCDIPTAFDLWWLEAEP